MRMTPKQIRNAVLITIIGILIFLFYLTFSRQNTRVINFNIAPTNAEVTLNNKPLTDRTKRLKYGDYTIKATLKDFTTVEKKITVSKDGDPIVSIVLDPTNDAGQSYLDSNIQEQYEREGVESIEVDKKQRTVAEKYPFLKELPLERQRFTISYGDIEHSKVTNPDDPQVALYVSVTEPSQKRNALRTIREYLGVDPSDIEIIFLDYFNPFDKDAYAD